MVKRLQSETAAVRHTLLDEEQAADYLGLSPRTLQNFRVRGGGPDYVKLGARAVRYRLSDLDEFIEDRVRSNTSQDEVDDDLEDAGEADDD